MMKLKKCPICGKYTLKINCCQETVSAHPPKFSVIHKIVKFNKLTKRRDIYDKDKDHQENKA